ncbi:MAG: YgiQ family radical SAM protein [Planctomycetota bacterium]
MAVMGEIEQPEFLPMSVKEMRRLGWDELDVLLVTGDAYVDHPSFAAALLGRWLVANGYRVGVVAQPRWETTEDVARMGRPRLFAGVTAGALDSMLAHYTAFRKKRSDDAYTPGGKAGARPNRACIVYAGLVKRAFRGLPVVLGGIEASLRRVSHYDFWSDSLRRSLVLDSKAALLLYGMAELGVVEAAQQLAAGEGLHGIRGSVFAGKREEIPASAKVVELPSHEEIESRACGIMDATLALEAQMHDGETWAIQWAGRQGVVVAPPAKGLTTEELDRVYALPFTRRPHPSYREAIPAVEMVQFSITGHRGCGGGCTFCALALHQGRRIQSRSVGSILDEAKGLTSHPQWRGSVSDVGGPSANLWGARCAAGGPACKRRSCLFPSICPNFQSDQKGIVRMLRAVAGVEGVKHVRVASGVRWDVALTEPDYLRALVGEFTGGQMKVAPEHVSEGVLALMRKPGAAVFEEFLSVFERESKRAGKEQYVVPYLMSAFPGCTDEDMEKLARWLRARGWKPQQVQCFIPTPGTVATAMYYAGVDPEGRKIPVARTDAQRLRQHAILLGKRGSPRRRAP